MSDYEEKIQEDDVYAAELLRRQKVDSLYAVLNVPRDLSMVREAEEAELEAAEAQLRAEVDAILRNIKAEGGEEKASEALAELRRRCEQLREKRQWRDLDDDELLARRVKKAHNHLAKHFHGDKQRNPRGQGQGNSTATRPKPSADSATFAELTHAKK